jgi:hypothetical protein
MTRGHVYIVHGDLTKIAAHAWLMPCDRWPGIERYWVPEDAPAALRDRFAPVQFDVNGAVPRPSRHTRFHYPGPLPDGWGSDGVRVARIDDWQVDAGPRPYLCNVGGSRRVAAEWFIEGVRQFLEISAADCTASLHRYPQRSRPLLALPLVGTGKGGAQDEKGGMIRALLRFLYEALEGAGPEVDVALVVKDARMYAAVQAHRKQLLTEGGVAAQTMWGELDDAQMANAARLAQHARQGRLALFLGAGVSQGAGLPGWDELLERLASRAQLSPEEAAAFESLEPYDAARILEHRLGGPDALRMAISDELVQPWYALGHALLAGLGIREVVTLNYDDLFESALRAIDADPAVLPYQPASSSESWVLKMHGCVRHRDEIVLTRRDYLRYSERRAALAGLVQGLLITRHMLFVGFSLSDDNFHRIADDVRKAMGLERPADGERIVTAEFRGDFTDQFGTALLLGRNQLLEDLWLHDLDLVPMDHISDHGFLCAARRLDIFLDHVGACAVSSGSYLLDDTYAELLSSDELKLRSALLRLREQIDTIDAADVEAVAVVRALLAALGGT